MKNFKEPSKEVKLEITVNGTPKNWSKRTLAYDEIVQLAYGATPSNPNTYYTVTYKRGQGHGEQGKVAPGQEIKATNKMKLYVTASNKS
ncbi:multiubiquitin domain-containing protein [Gramella sp. GC03-9]|uniref:Multiubiquitin domain-containing protein n=1 Tax=Christiangramia oceanisediminis TaxID=2920386 RepID=A0A9X2KWE7_9FLAO|nr:multiubiquitin domain-containing protein [Gramella oceanisediminis]MCP9199244.1 multiubiquitin domain-containing protein [Gramella oceanisediminis]